MTCVRIKSYVRVPFLERPHCRLCRGLYSLFPAVHGRLGPYGPPDAVAVFEISRDETCGKPREQVYSCARLYSARACMYYVACATR